MVVVDRAHGQVALGGEIRHDRRELGGRVAVVVAVDVVGRPARQFLEAAELRDHRSRSRAPPVVVEVQSERDVGLAQPRGSSSSLSAITLTASTAPARAASSDSRVVARVQAEVVGRDRSASAPASR